RVISGATGFDFCCTSFIALLLLRCWRLRRERGQIGLHVIEAFGPESPVGFHPLRSLLERFGTEVTAPFLRLYLAPDELGLLQHLEMPGDRRRRDGEGLRKLAHRGAAMDEPAENGAPRWVSKGGEGAGQRVHELSFTARLINICVN